MSRWKILPVPEVADDYDGHFHAIRLNSLGSLYWFTKYTLGKNRLRKLHEHLCRSLEVEDFHLVLEVPMGMFKSTMATALSIWWALPFAIEDEHEMAKLGYTSRWMEYMRRVHNPNTRTLVAHEIDKRAVDIGKEVDFTYYENDLFRQVFASILPDKNCDWNDHSKYQKRSRDFPIDPTNPTFAYCGVGHALQGVRADSTIEDDCFGRAAQDSMLRGDGKIVENIIRWHRQLTTRIDTANTSSRRYRQLVVGNRWGHADLNSWIRKNQPRFIFETHDAEGGCCKLHPKHGVPIFPEEFSMDVLRQMKVDSTPYDYAHFRRNLSVLPEECIFQKEWINYFRFKRSRPEMRDDDPRNILLLEHVVKDGNVIEDCQPGGLELRIILDPNHAKKKKRTKHVIWSIGYDKEKSRIYLLSLWAKECPYTELVRQLYKEHRRWLAHNHIAGYLPIPIYMSGTALKLLSFYLEQQDRTEKVGLNISEFDFEESLEAVKNRVEALELYFKNGQIWSHESHADFLEAVESYPAGEIDTLDVLGHFTQTVDVRHGVDDFIKQQQDAFINRSSGAGGY